MRMLYSECKIEKALNMKFHKRNNTFYVKAQSDKECYKYKLVVGPSGIPVCNCFWFTYRTRSNPKKWGLCSHQLGYLHKYNKKQFWKEVSR